MAFGDRIELALDFPDAAPPGSAHHGVHMLMWQDAKHRRRRPRTEVEDDDAVVAPPSSGLCSVTMHTRVDVEREMTAENVESRLHAAVADLVGMTPEDIRSLAVGGDEDRAMAGGADDPSEGSSDGPGPERGVHRRLCRRRRDVGDG